MDLTDLMDLTTDLTDLMDLTDTGEDHLITDIMDITDRRAGPRGSLTENTENLSTTGQDDNDNWSIIPRANNFKLQVDRRVRLPQPTGHLSTPPNRGS